jgi:tRNA-binding protein
MKGGGYEGQTLYRPSTGPTARLNGTGGRCTLSPVFFLVHQHWWVKKNIINFEKMKQIAWQEFEQVELRTGTIIKVEDFPEAKKAAYKLEIDLGEFGIKKSSVQITHLYKKEDLVGRQIICVVNFSPKQIANFFSEVLTTGFYLPTGEVVLACPERQIPNGLKLA